MDVIGWRWCSRARPSAQFGADQPWNLDSDQHDVQHLPILRGKKKAHRCEKRGFGGLQPLMFSQLVSSLTHTLLEPS